MTARGDCTDTLRPKELLAASAAYLVWTGLVCTRFFSYADLNSHYSFEADAAHVCWIIQWAAHALITDPGRLLAANAFHPFPRALVLSEPFLLYGMLAIPFRLAGAGVWTALNVFLFSSCFLSALGGYLLCRRIGGSPWAGFWGGCFWGFLFYRASQAAHLHIIGWELLPVLPLLAARYLHGGSGRVLLLWGVTLLVQFFLGAYQIVFAGCVLSLALPGLCPFSRRGLVRLAKLGAASLPAVLAAGWAGRAWLSRGAFTPPAAWPAVAWGDRAATIFTPPRAALLGHLLPQYASPTFTENCLYWGIVPLCLAAAGLAMPVSLWKSSSAEEGAASAFRWYAVGAALLLGGLVLSVTGLQPLSGVLRMLPGGAYLAAAAVVVRGLPRYLVVADVGVMILSTLALRLAAEKYGACAAAALSLVLSLLFLIDHFPVYFERRPEPFVYSRIDREIAAQQLRLGREAVVFHHPVHFFRNPPVDWRESRYELGSTLHWARLINGYSSYYPRDFVRRMAVLRNFPDAASLKLLAELGTDLIAVHTDEIGADEADRAVQAAAAAGYVPVGGDPRAADGVLLGR